MADLPNESPVSTMHHSFFKRVRAIFLILLILIILIGGVVYAYLQWMQVTISFTNNIHELQHVTRNHQETIESLQSTIVNLQQTVSQSEAKMLQQAQIIQDIQGVQKGHFDTWRAAEAAHLVRLADDHLQFTNDISMVIALLQRAEEVLQQAEDTMLLNIRQSIVADIARFKMIPSTNVTILYQQLTTLNDQLDQLPLPAFHTTPKEEPVAIQAQTLPWWKIGLYQSLAVLKKIIIVHHQGVGTVPLILPEEKIFLYQNLHAQMNNVIWSVMYRQPIIYEASLNRLIAWIGRYFDQSSQQTRSLLLVLQHLKGQDIRPSPENLNATLQQFNHYFSSQSKLMTDALLKREATIIPAEPAETR